jgi:hypothetical protein
MPAVSTEQAFNIWAERQYAKGRRRFILVHGMLGFAIPGFVVTSALDWWSPHFPLRGIWLVSWLIISLGFWCALGYGFGQYRWRSVERRALRSPQQ